MKTLLRWRGMGPLQLLMRKTDNYRLMTSSRQATYHWPLPVMQSGSSCGASSQHQWRCLVKNEMAPTHTTPWYWCVARSRQHKAAVIDYGWPLATIGVPTPKLRVRLHQVRPVLLPSCQETAPSSGIDWPVGGSQGDMDCSSVLKKRRKKMNKHKYKKRRKKLKFLRRRLGK